MIRVILGAIFGFGWWLGPHGWMRHFGIGLPLVGLLGLLSFVLWIICMIKAFQGQRFKLPLAGDFAESVAGH